MRERTAQITPACRVHCIDDFVDPDNWLRLLPQDADAVIDACDQVKAKTAMAAHARATRQCFISVGAAGGKRLAHKVDIDDLSADRKSTRLNSSHLVISYAVFCLKKKKTHDD